MEGRDESCASHSEGRKKQGGAHNFQKRGGATFDTEERLSWLVGGVTAGKTQFAKIHNSFYCISASNPS